MMNNISQNIKSYLSLQFRRNSIITTNMDKKLLKSKSTQIFKFHFTKKCKIRMCIFMIVLFIWYSLIIYNGFNLQFSHSIKNTTSLLMGLRDYNEVYTTQYVSKFGIAILTDKHDDMEYFLRSTTSDKINNLHKFQNIKHGDIIWIRELQLVDFVNIIVPNINQYFTLVIATNKAWVMPLKFDENGYKTYFNILLNNKYLLYIFSENYDATLQGTKYENIIEPIPIGMDFHTFYMAPQVCYKKFGHFDTPSQQEIKIQKILNTELELINYNKREMKIYIDYPLNIKLKLGVDKYMQLVHIWNQKFDNNWIPNNNFHTYRNNKSSEILKMYSKENGAISSRREWYRSWTLHKINNILNKNELFYIDNKKYSQYNGFIKRSKYIFSLSPFGNGLDCHRTYESLLFGNIVIMQKSPLDILWEKHNLPIITIQNYNEINKTMLNQGAHELQLSDKDA
eukprot:213123_1